MKDALSYGRISTSKQGTTIRQNESLNQFAKDRGFEVVKYFDDTISGKSLSTERSGFNKMMKYAKQHDIKVILCSEVSRIGRRVSDVIHTIETLVEDHGFTIYFQHPNELVFKAGKGKKIDILQKSMLMMLSLGAEMELHYQAARRLEGIEIAKRENRYKGRIKGSTYSRDQMINRHKDIVALLQNSQLPDTQIALTLGKGLSTVKRVKKLLVTK